MDRQLTIDLNRLSVHLLSFRGLLADGVHFGVFALLLLAIALAAGMALRGGLAADGAPRLRVLAAALPAGGIAYLAAVLIAARVGRAAPPETLRAVTAIVTEGRTSLPDPFSAAAGALAMSLILGRARLLAVAGALLAILEAFAVVVVGAAFVTDVIAGLGLGAVVTLMTTGVLGLLEARGGAGIPSKRSLTTKPVESPGAIAGPATRQAAPEPTGSVTILSGGTIRPRALDATESRAGGYVPSS